MTENQMINKVAKCIAESMMAHFENPIEDPYEFFPEEEYPECEGVADWISENVQSMYDDNTRPLREKIHNELKSLLKI